MKGELENNSLDSTLDESGENGASNQDSKQKTRSQLSVLFGLAGEREKGGKNIILFYTS